MKSWISTSLVKCTDVVVAVGGVVLCSCFLFPVSEACSIAVGGIDDCTHSESSSTGCPKHPDAGPGQVCVDRYVVLSHLSGNTPDNAYGADDNVCLGNSCKSLVRKKSVPCTIPGPGGPE
ncbi:MAG: hypothetical protein ACK5PB_03565 [Pirellula sp.]|jgi:hypothetical protein